MSWNYETAAETGGVWQTDGDIGQTNGIVVLRIDERVVLAHGSLGYQLKRRSVLVIDNDSSIVRLLELQLTPATDDVFAHEVEVFTDPQAALARAATRQFDAVISDYRMPVMDGVAFLRAFAVLQPQCARLMLSGYSDTEAVLRMVDGAAIHRFIPKPWSRSELMALLDEAIASVEVPQPVKRRHALPRATSTTLRTSPLLAELPDATLEQLATVAHWQAYNAGEIILQQNAQSHSVYFVISGYVKLMRGLAQPERLAAPVAVERRLRVRPPVMLALLGPGDVAGEVALWLNVSDSPSIVALTPCQVIRFASADLLACVQQYPPFALAVAHKMALRLMAADQQIELMRGDLQGRIHAIIRHCRQIGLDVERWLTKAEIARMVGATRVAVSQTMGRTSQTAQDKQGKA